MGSNFYRKLACSSLERAKSELTTGDDHRYRYAALELRMALESLIYEKAENYSEELCGKELETWQPRQLLKLLLEIVPFADKSYTLEMGEMTEDGQVPEKMTLLGNEKLVSLQELKKYYDRLGSYLHTPTASQLQNQTGPDSAKVLSRCSEVASIIEEVLASKIFNSNFRSLLRTSCLKCEAEIVRRVPIGQESFIAKCINCVATYDVCYDGNDLYTWRPRKSDVKCLRIDCGSPYSLWEGDSKIGNYWTCTACGGRNTICYGLNYDHPNAHESGAGEN